MIALGSVGCTLAYVQCSWLASDIDRFDYPKELLLQFLALAGTGICLLCAVRSLVTPVDVLLIAFCTLAALSALTTAPANSWLAWRSILLSVSGVCLFWSTRYLAGRGRATVIESGLTMALAAAAVTTLLEAHGLFPDLSLFQRAPGGTLGVRNYAGHFLVVGLPLLVWRAVRARRLWSMLATNAVICTAVCAIVLTRSRAAWLGGFALIAVALAVGATRSRVMRTNGLYDRMLGVSGAMLLGIVLAIFVPNQLAWRSGTPTLDTLSTLTEWHSGSGKGRLLQYQYTLQMIGLRPMLGIGPGQWPVEYPRHAPPGDPTYQPESLWPTPPRANSDWLGFASERGLSATAMLALALLSVAWSAWRSLHASSDAPAALRSIAILCILVVYLAISVLDCFLQLAPGTLIFFGSLGLLWMPENHRLVRMPFPARIAVGSSLVLVALTVTWPLSRDIQALRLASGARSPEDWTRAADMSVGHSRLHAQAALAWVEAGRCDRALPHAAMALSLNPNLKVVERVWTACRR